MSLFLKILSILSFSFLSRGDYHESLLLRDLANGYNIYERPVANHGDPVIVKLDFELQQIVDVNEKLQEIQTIACLKYKWTDQNLKWQPSEYGHITELRLPINKVWRPDVLLYNSVDAGFEKTFAVNVKLMFDGTIYWEPPAVMKTSCKIDVTYFPFDDQQCHFKFGSWTYNGNKLELQIGEQGLDTRRYITNGEWLLLESSGNRTTQHYACCPNDPPYYDLKFYLRLRRRTLFYGFNLIIPSLLVSMMSLLAFTLPPDAGEKIALELTVLLSLCYCLQMIADMTPPTSEAVPLLGLFFVCCIFLISCSSVFCVLVLNLHHADPDTKLAMHPWLAIILLKWLPMILLMARPKRQDRKIDKQCHPNTKRSSKFVDEPVNMKDDEKFTSIIPQTNFSGRNAVVLAKMIELLREKTKNVAKVFRKNKEDSEFINDWKYAAMVIDRMCLIIFTTMIVSFTCSIFFSASYVSA